MNSIIFVNVATNMKRRKYIFYENYKTKKVCVYIYIYIIVKCQIDKKKITL